jgi:hypothetical protein
MRHSPLLALLLLACSPDSDLVGDSGDTLPEPGAPSQERLLAHVELLASAAYGGREPGTEGGRLAETYLEEHFASLALEGAGDDGGYRQTFPLQRWTITGPSELSVGAVQASEGQDFELFSYSGAGEAEGELVFVGYGLTVPPFDPSEYPGCPLDPAGYDDYQGMDLAGGIALVMRHAPNDDWDIADHCPANEAAEADADLLTFGYKAVNAAQHGAAGMLLVNDYLHDGAAEGGTIGEGYFQEAFPALFARRGLLEDQLPELESWAGAIDAGVAPNPQATGLSVRMLTQTEVTAIEVPNILARIPGSEALGHEAVLVGAHFDHLGTDGAGNLYAGADDNASGTAVVLELAQLFAEWGAQPERTLIFAGFNAEELGLIGSMYYVIEPPHPIEDTVAMVNLDMVGGGDELGLIDFGGLDSGSEELYELLATQQSDDFPLTPLEAGGNSDHAWFQYAGVPVAFLFTTGAHAVYHSPEDTFDRISGLELEETARISWDTLRILAMGQEEEVLEAAARQPRVAPPPIAPELLPPVTLPALR